MASDLVSCQKWRMGMIPSMAALQQEISPHQENSIKAQHPVGTCRTLTKGPKTSIQIALDNRSALLTFIAHDRHFFQDAFRKS